jgi:ribonuclease HI
LRDKSLSQHSRSRGSSNTNITFGSQVTLCNTIAVQQWSWKCTNNIAEYEAILLGLRKLRVIGVQRCTLRTDSKVVAGKIEKEWIARDATLKRYLALVRRMENYFKGFTVEHVDRNKNTEVDELAKAAAHNTPLPVDVFL